MILMLIVVGILFGGIFAWKMLCARSFGDHDVVRLLPPATVSTIVVHYEMWQPQIETVGTLQAVNGADLSVELPGVVQEIDFNSGDDVAAGSGAYAAAADDDIGRLNSLQAAADLAADHLRARSKAGAGARHQPGGARHQRGQSRSAQGTGG